MEASRGFRAPRFKSRRLTRDGLGPLRFLDSPSRRHQDLQPQFTTFKQLHLPLQLLWTRLAFRLEITEVCAPHISWILRLLETRELIIFYLSFWSYYVPVSQHATVLPIKFCARLQNLIIPPASTSNFIYTTNVARADGQWHGQLATRFETDVCQDQQLKLRLRQPATFELPERHSTASQLDRQFVAYRSDRAQALLGC
jgi:hypothetical protein